MRKHKWLFGFILLLPLFVAGCGPTSVLPKPTFTPVTENPSFIIVTRYGAEGTNPQVKTVRDPVAIKKIVSEINDSSTRIIRPGEIFNCPSSTSSTGYDINIHYPTTGDRTFTLIRFGCTTLYDQTDHLAMSDNLEAVVNLFPSMEQPRT